MSFSENMILLRTLSLKKIMNAARVYFSFRKSIRNKQANHSGMPISISIEPTTSCNLRCPECPSGLRNFTRPTGMLEENFFRKTIDDLASHLIYLTFYFQGEPYLNPKFLDMVKYASGKKIFTSTSTNAHYLNDENARKTVESGLHRMIISIDGATQETYEQYRVGGQLSKVIEGTKKIVAWRKKMKSKTPYLIFQFLVVKPNEHELEKIKKMAEDLGVDEVKFKTAQVYDFENGNELIPENEKYSRYRKNETGKWEIKSSLLNQCWRMWSGCVITWDGLVVPCCFDKDAKHKLGDLKFQNMKEVWSSQQYFNFRKSILISRKEID
ncbi:MAG: radical SAM/SPASM domain-containing protein, partial [Bacteroidota bacterium]